MREILFYKTENGKNPVENFLSSLSSKQAQKVTWVLKLVEDLERVPTKYFKKLVGTKNIWEVRVRLGSDIIRLLGFMYINRFVVLTNGFVKKSQKTPVKEIKIAENRMSNFLERK